MIHRNYPLKLGWTERQGLTCLEIAPLKTGLLWRKLASSRKSLLGLQNLVKAESEKNKHSGTMSIW